MCLQKLIINNFEITEVTRIANEFNTYFANIGNKLANEIPSAHVSPSSYLLFNKQFGFRSGHSTDHAILCILDKIQSAVESGLFSCGVFLDLSKAFDTVNHSILLDKLEHYGICGIAKEWFSSYLRNRKQIVSINNTCSDYLDITCGVLQGSVLGPLLFLIYINDFQRCSSKLDFHLFADDSNLLYASKSLSGIESIINAELVHVKTWLAANKLSLNIAKSNFWLFFIHPKRKRHSI